MRSKGLTDSDRQSGRRSSLQCAEHQRKHRVRSVLYCRTIEAHCCLAAPVDAESDDDEDLEEEVDSDEVDDVEEYMDTGSEKYAALSQKQKTKVRNNVDLRDFAASDVLFSVFCKKHSLLWSRRSRICGNEGTRLNTLTKKPRFLPPNSTSMEVSPR